MRKWQIWSEGYLVTGMEGRPATAQYHGEFEGETFQQACDNWAKTIGEPHYYNRTTLTYWACRLFDNEKDARERFG